MFQQFQRLSIKLGIQQVGTCLGVLCLSIGKLYAVDPLVDPEKVFSSDPAKNLELKIETMFSEFERRFSEATQVEEKRALTKQFEMGFSDRLAELELLAVMVKKAQYDLPTLEASSAETYVPRTVTEQNLFRLADFYRAAEAAGYDAGTPPMDPNLMELIARGGGRTTYSASEFAALHTGMQRDAVIKNVRTLTEFDPAKLFDLMVHRLDQLDPKFTVHMDLAAVREQLLSAISETKSLRNFAFPSDHNPPSGPSSTGSSEPSSNTSARSAKDSASPNTSERTIAPSIANAPEKAKSSSFPWPAPILKMAERIDDYFQRRSERAEARRIGRLEKRRLEGEAKLARQTQAQAERQRRAEERARIQREKANQKSHERWVRENNIYWSPSYKPESQSGDWLVNILGGGTLIGIGGGMVSWWWMAIHAMVSESYYMPNYTAQMGIIVVPVTAIGAIAGCASLISHLAEKSRIRRDRERHPWKYY